MQSLQKALEGRWSVSEKYEADEWTPNGGTGYGEEVWRRGPGGFTFMEEIHDHTPGGEEFGVGFSWWDKSKGLQGLWCVNTNPQGCDLQSAFGGFSPKWDGKQLVIHTEFPRDGKTFVWQEVFSDITPTSFIQTADIGEKGGPLKRWLTIHATRIGEATMHNTPTNSDEADLRAFMAALRQASVKGDVETITNSITDDYVQTDINGYRQDKTTWLNEYFRPLADLIKTGKFHWDEYERKDLKFRFYGDCAIVTGELQMKGTGAKPGLHHMVADPNASFSGTLHFTHVYIKRNDKWMLAALHNQMPLPPADAAK